MNRRSILMAVVFAAACASKPTEAPPAPAPVAPPAAELARSGLRVVDETELTLRDAARSRDVKVRVTYPKGDGRCPVIVFSHGAGGSGTSYQPLARFWATKGYIVLTPTHADSLAGKGETPSLEALRETAADAVQDAKGWENRVRDVTFTIDSIPDIGERIPALKGRLDGARLGVGGHSYGAFTAQLLAGVTVTIPKGPKGKSFADPRPKAFLLLSPQGKGQQGLTEQSWSAVTRPVMVMTGSRDKGLGGQDPSWRLDPFRLSPPGDQYAVFLEGAGHLSFTGRAAEPGASVPRGKGGTTSEEQVAVFKQVKIASAAFWDAYLEGEAGALAFLKSDALDKESGGKAKLTSR